MNNKEMKRLQQQFPYIWKNTDMLKAGVFGFIMGMICLGITLII